MCRHIGLSYGHICTRKINKLSTFTLQQVDTTHEWVNEQLLPVTPKKQDQDERVFYEIQRTPNITI